MKRKGSTDRLISLCMVVTFVVLALAMILVLISPLHPFGLGEEITTGTVVAHEETRPDIGGWTWTTVYIKTDGENTIILRFVGSLDLNLELGNVYKFTYHTEPWNSFQTLDNYQEVN